MDTLDPEHYGVYSHNWLLIHALHHAPHAQVVQGIGAMLAYFDNAEEPNIATAIDMLGQYGLAGSYIPTTEQGCDDPSHDHEAVDYSDTFSVEDPITEAEIADFIAEMGEYPDGKGID